MKNRTTLASKALVIRASEFLGHWSFRHWSFSSQAGASVGVPLARLPLSHRGAYCVKNARLHLFQASRNESAGCGFVAAAAEQPG
jgi:hypothetical protein